MCKRFNPGSERHDLLVEFSFPAHVWDQATHFKASSFAAPRMALGESKAWQLSNNK